MENQNQIKVSENEAFVVGRLKEKKIDFKANAEGKLMATGYIVVATDTPYGKGEVRLSVMQNALTKDGKENSLYKGLQTVAGEYKSEAETGSLETADLIKVKGSLTEETYYSVKKGDFVEKVGIKCSFINRTGRTDKSGNPIDDCVKVAVEGYIAEIKPVGEELEVKFIAIGYGGVAIPITGYVEKDLVIPFQGRHQVGQTTTLYFAIVNTVEVTEVQKEVGFGQGLGEVIEKTIVKNIIFGGGAINYNGYTQDQIRQALSLREVALEKKKVKAEEKAQNGGTAGVNMNAGFGAPTGAPTGFSAPTGGFGTSAGGFNMPTNGFGV